MDGWGGGTKSVGYSIVRYYSMALGVNVQLFVCFNDKKDCSF